MRRGPHLPAALRPDVINRQPLPTAAKGIAPTGRGGAQLRAWPREILQASWCATHELYEDTAAQNPRFRKMWTSYKAFRDEQFQWFRVAENAYENFAFAAAAQR